MADLRDGFLAAVTAYLHSGSALQLLTAPADCCPGRVTTGPAGCTCWQPIYDRDQADPDPDSVIALTCGEITPDEQDGMCTDCAYRPNSAEKQGQSSHAGDAVELERLAASGQKFFCHEGFRVPVAWEHPAGMRIPADPTREGDYQPPSVLGIPYRATAGPDCCAPDGQPASARCLPRRNPLADNDIRSPFGGMLEQIRATDPRVDPVIRCLVAYRMGWSQDDPVDQVVPLVLDSMAAGSVVVAAKRLLERLDAMVVRELAGFYGEDAVFEAMSRVDDRVRTLTAERDFYRAAWEADRDGSAQPPDGTGA